MDKMFVVGKESGLRWVRLNDECIADSMKKSLISCFFRAKI